MDTIKTNLIPSKATFIGESKTLNLKGICVFAATGFFLDDDTFYLEQKTLKPAHEYVIEKNKIVSSKPYFHWHYTPIERPFNQVVNEFATLFEAIIAEQVANNKVILPLSGGLDSRTQAAALYHLKKEVCSYSYRFKNGHDETHYSQKIAKACGFPFQSLEVPSGYLWEVIDELANINQCYSEFTHPRQMAFIDQYASMGDVFSLGHWGDVLFDDMGVPDDLSLGEQVEVILKKIIKKGGLPLAETLWQEWHLGGNFLTYFKERIAQLLTAINIPHNANAQIRAFKSLYWAPRWTSTNLSVFESVKPITLPYYDDRMCAFICSVPEKYLKGRQIQIAYLKMRMPELAKITWQEKRPFNLYNYHLNKFPYNFPYRVYNKLVRGLNPNKLTQRNWELQFLGKSNEVALQKWLFENEAFKKLVPEKVTQQFYADFKNTDAVYNSHPVSMLLTLSLFSKQKK